jgi:hypothetical protein
MGVLTLVQNNNDPQCSIIETYLYEHLHTYIVYNENTWRPKNPN